MEAFGSWPWVRNRPINVQPSSNTPTSTILSTACETDGCEPKGYANQGLALDKRYTRARKMLQNSISKAWEMEPKIRRRVIRQR